MGSRGADPDEPERKTDDFQEVSRIPGFNSFKPCLSQPGGLGQVV